MLLMGKSFLYSKKNFTGKNFFHPLKGIRVATVFLFINVPGDFRNPLPFRDKNGFYLNFLNKVIGAGVRDSCGKSACKGDAQGRRGGSRTVRAS